MSTSLEETALITALLGGAFETPPWTTFLDELRRQTSADAATLFFRNPGRPLGESLNLFSGPVPAEEVAKLYGKHDSSLDFLNDLGLEEGRIYTYDEVYPPPNGRCTVFYEEIVVPSGVRHCLMARLTEPSGVSAWLTISRKAGELDHAAAAVMTLLAPILRGVLRLYVALKQEQFTAAVTSDAMRRLHFGWMALDADCQIVEHDPEAASVFALSGILSKSPSGRLVVNPPQLRAGIQAAVSELSGNPNARARAFPLSQDPWLDMLIMPASPSGISANPRATVVAYVHGDSWHATDRCDQLKQLFGLSLSEARLALTLSRGMTIRQAAEKLGITIQTARKCSKIIYAKTGAGGLPDLVRLVMRSILVLAPKD